MFHRGERLGEVWVARWLPELYVVLALLLAGSLCVITPSFVVTDEANHARRALQIGHGELLAAGASAGEDSNFLRVADEMSRLRADVLTRIPEGSGFPNGRYTAAELRNVQGIRWSHHEEPTSFPNTVVYPPGFYLPAAAGLALAEAANMTIVRSLMLARFAEAVCAIAIGWLALRLCGRGRWIIFGYLLLPTILNLEASCSQDGLLLPAAALVAVLLFRAVAAGRALRDGELVAMVAILALCVGARISYLPLVLVMLVPSLEAKERRLGRPLLGMLAVIAIVGAWELAVHSLGTSIAANANPAAQMLFLRTHPVHGSLSLMDALVRVIPVMMGKGLYMLGSNDVGPPHWLYGVMALGLLGIALLETSIGVRRRSTRIVLLVVVTGVLCGTSLAEYIIWTPPGALRVSGLQGRYFIPLIPLCFLLIAPILTRLRRWMFASVPWSCGRLLVASASLLSASVATVPIVAAKVFYLASVGEAFRILLR